MDWITYGSEAPPPHYVGQSVGLGGTRPFPVIGVFGVLGLQMFTKESPLAPTGRGDWILELAAGLPAARPRRVAVRK